VAYGPGQGDPPPDVPEGSGAEVPGDPGVPAVPGIPAFPGVPGINPAWLAATADRERAVGVLRAAFAEGRLSQEELDDRVAQAYTARTYGQLWALTADLPAGPLPYPGYPPAMPHPPEPHAVVPPNGPGVSSWRSAAALVVTALVIFILAALVTAIITAHTQTVVYTPVQQPVNLEPFITHQLPAHDAQSLFPRSLLPTRGS
jgi:Domain of unknown function (DUF1707)